MLNRRFFKKRRYPLSQNKKLIRYFTLFLVVFIPLFLGYSSLKNLWFKKGDLEKKTVDTGDRPLEKSLNVIVKADGGLNFRKEADKDSEKIGEIPDGTKLAVKKELNGWYQVEFNGKEGWISKEFTIIEEAAPKDEATKDWPEFNGAGYGFRIQYPLSWSYQDYGATPDGEASVAFSFSKLPAKLPPGSVFFAPIEIKISPKPQAILEDPYKKLVTKTVSEVVISGLKGVKYLYIDNTDQTEKTKIFLTVGAKSFVFSENGGYQTELDQMLKTYKSI
ncbi:MAG: SH3 domain-containing protein [Patescibacteria group bacterium]|nr:SH3 domain-containing protein [Patescibacteria group bacterium]MCL5093653.1 SH3 domain-containing protein [Patescibacteria group bacterium]